MRNSKQIDSSEFTARVTGSNYDLDHDGEPDVIEDKDRIVKVEINGYVLYGYTADSPNTYSFWANYPSLYSADGWGIVKE